MASGIIHDKFTRTLALPTSLLYLSGVTFMFEPKTALLMGLSYYIGIQLQRSITPDLDVDNFCYSFFLVDMFDPIIGMIWKIYWTPYRLIVKHRSWISHGFLIGTIIKAAYIMVLMYPLIIFMPMLDISIEWMYIVSAFIGMFVGDLGHLLLDYVMIARKIAERIFDE